ncbi:hypothetical protein J6590_105215, partial [Homalodisca vitripennis]
LIADRWRLTVLVVLSDRSIDRTQQVSSSHLLIADRWRLTVLVVLSHRSIDRTQKVSSSHLTGVLIVRNRHNALPEADREFYSLGYSRDRKRTEADKSP